MFQRTFHPDEANQAFTVGRLLETGQYTYRPDDHHGPTLYYAAAPLQKLFGHNSTQTLDGTLLRCTPLVFAVLALVFGFLSLKKIFGGAGKSSWHALFPACAFVLLLASAPIFVFFATDFIQEMLLAAFLLGMLFTAVSYLKSLNDKEDDNRLLKPGSWMLLFGISAGLAFATKETSVLSFAAAALALLPFGRALPSQVRTKDLPFVFFGFGLTVVLLFSSFGQDFDGVYNAFIRAPLAYFGRANGDSAASTGAAWHVHPWWMYAKWLFLSGKSWSLSSLLMLTAVGVLSALKMGRFHPLFSFALCYTLALFAIYSLIPYKTPWCGLQIAVGLALAAAGACQALDEDFARRTKLKGFSFVICLWVLGLAILQALCSAKMLRNPDSREIPYNYASAHPEVRELAACVHTALSATNAPSAFAAVALPACDTWPFPWYNRAHEHQTGYWTDFKALKQIAASGAKPAVVIVPMTEGHLVQPLFPHLKHTKRYFIRPGVRARVFW